MNNSLDLRNRILKMREINNFDFNKVQTFDTNQQDINLIQTKKENDTETSPRNIQCENVINKKNMLSHNGENVNLFSNNEAQSNSYDAQFRLLANKFNEAVEVILELSNSVKNLEKAVYLKDKKINQVNINRDFFNLKLIVFMTVIFLFVYGIVYLPIDLSMLKLILSDILTII